MKASPLCKKGGLSRRSGRQPSLPCRLGKELYILASAQGEEGATKELETDSFHHYYPPMQDARREGR